MSINFNDTFGLLITRSSDPAVHRALIEAALTPFCDEDSLQEAVDGNMERTIHVTKDSYINSNGYETPLVRIMGIQPRSGKYKCYLDVALGEFLKVPELMIDTGIPDPDTTGNVINYRHAVGTVALGAEELPCLKPELSQQVQEQLAAYAADAKYVPRMDESIRFDLSESIELPDERKFSTRGFRLTNSEYSGMFLLIGAPQEGIQDVWRGVICVSFLDVRLPEAGSEGNIKVADANAIARALARNGIKAELHSTPINHTVETTKEAPKEERKPKTTQPTQPAEPKKEELTPEERKAKMAALRNKRATAYSPLTGV